MAAQTSRKGKLTERKERDRYNNNPTERHTPLSPCTRSKEDNFIRRREERAATTKR
jgi:hypothetical protein